jgi:Putative prokaryotic signal transducing protein
MDGELVVLQVCENRNQAYFLKSVLAGSGVEAVIPDEYTGGYLPIGVGGVRLMVHADDVDRARAILDSINRGKR